MLLECNMKFFENDILTKEMLQRIYDDSLTLTKTLLSSIKDAIISGVEIRNTDNGNAEISEGVLIINGKLFVYDGSFVIEKKILKAEQHYRIYINKSNEKYSFAIEEDNNEKRDFVIFRFLFDGGDIVKTPKNLKELVRDNVYLNVFDMPYCDLQGNYICNPIIASCILNTLSDKRDKTLQETYIYYELLNKGNVGILLLSNYINGQIEDKVILNIDDLRMLLNTISNKVVFKETVKEKVQVTEVKQNKSVIATRKKPH